MSKLELVAAPEKQEIVIKRSFNFPRELVYKIYNDPQLLPQWWGPRYLTTEVDSMDVCTGGKWRFVQRAPDGGVHGFHGYYHTVTPNEQLAFTFEYEGMPGHVLLETLIFEDLDGGGTLITDTSVFQTLEDRNGMLESGMEGGAEESFERLTELLEKAS